MSNVAKVKVNSTVYDIEDSTVRATAASNTARIIALENAEIEVDTTLTQEGMAADAAAVGGAIGNLSELETEDKTDLVSAINEAAQSGGSGLVISDYDENDIYIEDDGTIVATGITLNQSALQFSSASSQTLTATLIPSNAQESVIWESSDETVATVVGTGTTATVTAVGNGTATITARTDVTALTAICSVTASGLPEVGVRYRLTGTDVTSDTTQVVGGANITFNRNPSPQEEGVYISVGTYMLIENNNSWFSDDWIMEFVIVPRISEDSLTQVSDHVLFDGKYGDLYGGTASSSGNVLKMVNPRTDGSLWWGAGSSGVDFRPYNNTECRIKVAHSASGSTEMYLNGTKILTTTGGIPATKNIYINGFNKDPSLFAVLLKSFVIRDGESA